MSTKSDFADNVVKRYMKEFIPNAMRIAREMRGEKERFVWTTGSWLIQKYLEEGENKEMLEDAIRHGEIRWHGIPFTTHTEVMDESLFLYDLRYRCGSVTDFLQDFYECGVDILNLVQLSAAGMDGKMLKEQ